LPLLQTARRHGETWFIGSVLIMNREVHFPFTWILGSGQGIWISPIMKITPEPTSRTNPEAYQSFAKEGEEKGIWSMLK